MTQKRFKEIVSTQKIVDTETGIEYDGLIDDELLDLMNEQEEQIQLLKKEIRFLKISYAKCRDCKYADKYVPDYAYPYVLPKCSKGVKSINYDSTACEDFEVTGRQSR